MKKNVLLEFIKKYSLNETIEKCRWVSNATDKTLKVSVASDTKNLLVDLTLAEWDGFGDAEVGIGNTKKFNRELNGLVGEEIDLVINYNDDNTRIIGIDVMNGKTVGKFTCSDLDMIPQSSKMKTLPPFNAEIIIDSAFKEQFLKAKSALPDVTGFTVMMNKKGVLELIIGYSNINSSRFCMSVKTTPGKDTVSEPIHFNAEYLKEILSSNSECDDTTLYISDDGLASISFTSGNFTAKYFLTPLDDQD
jgi:hypothetical protein